MEPSSRGAIAHIAHRDAQLFCVSVECGTSDGSAASRVDGMDSREVQDME